MKFVPNRIVSYRGVLHLAGIPFEIEAEYAEDMKRYGEIVHEEEDVRKSSHPKRERTGRK